MHYHKTGSFASTALQNAVHHQLNMPMDNGGRHRHCICGELPCPTSSGAHVMKWTAPELILRQTPVPACYTFVHMVRDPARWTISWYDYHRQSPTPEIWIERYYPKCYPALWEHVTALNMSKRVLDDAIALCQRLVQPNVSFYSHLSILSEFDGMRLSALVNILGGESHHSTATGDMLRSAVNAKVLSQSPRIRVLNLLLDDLIIQPVNIITDIVSVVFDAAKVDAASDSLRSQMLHAQNGSMSARSKHITTFRRSAAEKDSMVDILYKDEVLGPIFMLWWRFFNASPPTAPPPNTQPPTAARLKPPTAPRLNSPTSTASTPPPLHTFD